MFPLVNEDIVLYENWTSDQCSGYLNNTIQILNYYLSTVTYFILKIYYLEYEFSC